jgi:hypothetical protein
MMQHRARTTSTRDLLGDVGVEVGEVVEEWEGEVHGPVEEVVENTTINLLFI